MKGFLALTLGIAAVADKAKPSLADPCSQLVGYNDFLSNMWCQTACRATQRREGAKTPIEELFKRARYLRDNCYLQHWSDGKQVVRDDCWQPYTAMTPENIVKYYNASSANGPASCQGNCQLADNCAAFVYLVDSPNKDHCFLLNETQAQAFYTRYDLPNPTLPEILCTEEKREAGECLICQDLPTAAVKDDNVMFGWKYCRKENNVCVPAVEIVDVNGRADTFC